LLQEIHLVAADFRTVNEVQIPILKLIDRTDYVDCLTIMC